MSAGTPSLYPPLVIAHSRHPSNCRALPEATHRATGAQPLCGDHLELAARIEGGRVLDIAFHGVGCAVARASASLLTEAVLGRQTAHGRRLLRRFEQFLESREMEGDADLGELSVFAVVRAHPARKPCALLAWEAWQRILEAADAAQPSPDSRASSRSDHHTREVSTP